MKTMAAGNEQRPFLIDIQALRQRARDHTEQGGVTTGCDAPENMIQENLAAERVAVVSYGEIIHYLGDNDPTTRIMIETILSKEEEHPQDTKILLESIEKKQGRRRRRRITK